MALISPQNEKCEDVKRDYEIYFADSYAKTVNHLIKYVGEDGFTIIPFPFPSNEKLKYPVALDYDPNEELIYWTDMKTGKVCYFIFILFFYFIFHFCNLFRKKFTLCNCGPRQG